MVTIKLRRIGKKHQASFQLVAAERRARFHGTVVEKLGWFDPHANTTVVNADRVHYWFSVGAQATPAAHNLLVRAGALDAAKIPVHKRPKKNATPVEDTAVSSEAPSGEAVAESVVQEEAVAQGEETAAPQEKADALAA